MDRRGLTAVTGHLSTQDRLNSVSCPTPAATREVSPRLSPRLMKLLRVGNTLILTVPKRVAEAMG